ncbi:MAG: alanine--tRNA ligase [Candidatus Altiarchaeales archaeon]|nr:alanine--tRNA ligase [Candidatus Altiarchaeales archaeon]
MAWDFKGLKARVKGEFMKNFQKYYPVESLKQMGFSRKICSKCGRGFWTIVENDVCGEASCQGGYTFIGEKLARKEFGYKEAWGEYVKTFKKWGYVPIKRYPVVCRWYEELYFVNAGINDFQPYVVAGEVEPPAPAVLEPQFCLRFNDIDNVGITGAHYSGFIMVGQHTFNTPQKHVYFKDEGILQMHEFLTKGLGIKPEEITYHEDVWAGGGNYGPSMEFFSRGLELGNQVYMQYEVLPDGTSRELKTKVIDMGAGLERWSWFSQGKPMSYDTVFPKVLEYLYKQAGRPDTEFMNKFGRYAGLLNIDEIDDVRSVWDKVSKEIGMPLDELKRQAYRMRALYALGDHTRTLLVAMHDGALPSNVGGGYNLRTLLRRCWDLIDEFQLDIELEKLFELHIKEFGSWYNELKEEGSLYDILDTERRRYEEGKEKGRKIVERMISNREKITAEKLVELYDSQGISPELVKAVNPEVEVPENFYKLVEDLHTGKKTMEVAEKIELPKDIPETRLLYYEADDTEFNAKVLKVFKDFVILDRTLFYAEGGGQDHDVGTLNGIEVSDVQKHAGIVLHKVSKPERFKEGMEVAGIVNPKHRKQLTQHHTAAHIVNAAARMVLGPHIWQAGANKTVESARLDITHYKAVSDEELKKIESKANEIVGKSVKIEKKVMKRNEAEIKYGFRLYQGGAVPGVELRVVNIAGIDVEACSGTHLNNTKETGKIKLVSAKRIQDGVVRLEFKAGKAAVEQAGGEEELFNACLHALEEVKLEDSKPDLEKLKNAARALSTPLDQLPKTLEKFMKEYSENNAKLKALKQSTLELKQASDIEDASKKLFEIWKTQKKMLEKQGGNIAMELEKEIEKKFERQETVKHKTQDIDIKTLTEIARKTTQKPGRLLIIANTSGSKANIIVSSSSNHNAGEVCKKICQKLDGGGSGTQTLAMGGGNAKNIEKTLEELGL